MVRCSAFRLDALDESKFVCIFWSGLAVVEKVDSSKFRGPESSGTNTNSLTSSLEFADDELPLAGTRTGTLATTNVPHLLSSGCLHGLEIIVWLLASSVILVCLLACC